MKGDLYKCADSATTFAIDISSSSTDKSESVHDFLYVTIKSIERKHGGAYIILKHKKDQTKHIISSSYYVEIDRNLCACRADSENIYHLLLGKETCLFVRGSKERDATSLCLFDFGRHIQDRYQVSAVTGITGIIGEAISYYGNDVKYKNAIKAIRLRLEDTYSKEFIDYIIEYTNNISERISKK